MSILIKDMKMPKNCFYCKMGYVYGDVDNAKLMCTITAKVIPLGKSLDIMKNCPLVNVSTPHGRLIDADKLVRHMEERQEQLNDDEALWEVSVVDTFLSDAPTVIESEEQKNE